MGIFHYRTPITSEQYTFRYVNDESVMQIYEGWLLEVNSKLKLTTTLKELPVMFHIYERWDSIIAERNIHTPSKEKARDLFIADLLEAVKLNEDEYLNKYRKTAFDLIERGQNVMMKGLGYLIIGEQFTRDNGEEILEGISRVGNPESVIISLAEGAAIAYYQYRKKHITEKKQFNEYFISDYSEKLPHALKEAFSGKKGKEIRLMIEVLKAKGIINFIGTDEDLFRAIESYFGGKGSIGSRVAIFQTYQFNPEKKQRHKNEFNDMCVFIENIIKELH